MDVEKQGRVNRKEIELALRQIKDITDDKIKQVLAGFETRDKADMKNFIGNLYVKTVSSGVKPSEVVAFLSNLKNTDGKVIAELYKV